MVSTRLGCSTISFRRLDLGAALATIADLGFSEVDLGSLPGVCEHVPLDLDRPARSRVVAAVRANGLAVRSINADIGDLNRPISAGETAQRRRHLEELLALAADVGSMAVVLPNGALSRAPIQSLTADLDLVAAELTAAAAVAETHGVGLWTESLHVLRLCCTVQRATALAERLAGSTVGHVLDVSHVVASGAHLAEAIAALDERIEHVHLRDATRGEPGDDSDPLRPGNINLSIGRGEVDFDAGLRALGDSAFTGHLTLELETHDIDDRVRPAVTAAAARTIEALLDTHLPTN
ncbi:sugar phosphate isomerase/epimerase family protein [Gordonia sp. SL306]|uniref:sugar phosphate isomerase/epimerase family protein n=1 Tax=Gordonia sp. SL306 TaxID=2995145 RepID=UPI002271173B|nr:sugar phosphate isomerase/epimerase [Gordonia sp. SL306]WAC57128.1 sugar phosphate isomerase/epimerase [Gordonia sp. SL306]